MLADNIAIVIDKQAHDYNTKEITACWQNIWFETLKAIHSRNVDGHGFLLLVSMLKVTLVVFLSRKEYMIKVLLQFLNRLKYRESSQKLLVWNRHLLASPGSLIHSINCQRQIYRFTDLKLYRFSVLITYRES